MSAQIFRWAAPLFALMTLVGGCNCQSSVHGPVTPNPHGLGTAEQSTDSSRQRASGVGDVAEKVFVRTHDSVANAYQTGEAANDLNIRLVGKHELAVIPTAGYVAFVRPGTREVAYLAFTCTKPGCQAHAKNGRPFVFPQPYKLIKLNDRGEIDWTPISVLEGPGPEDEGMPRCPICRSNTNVKVYVLPEVEPRLAQLDAELQQSRIALREARRANTQFPQSMRPPIVILQEIASLPQLFISCPIRPDGTNSVWGVP